MITFGEVYSDYKTFKKHKGRLGIEIETEAFKPYSPKSFSFWDVHRDDSLRGPAGYEYVLKVPLDYGDQLDQALAEFEEKTKDIQFNQKSWTTSVHVHTNMIHESLLTIVNYLTVYSLTENLLVKFAGDDRKSNLFCLPMIDAQTNVQTAKQIVNGIVKKRYNDLHLDPQSHKYAALNLASLHNLGSFECRLMRGTTDIKVIKTWASILNNMLNFARRDITPTDITLQWQRQSVELLSEIFGENRKDIRTDNEIELVDKNLWFAANIAGLEKNWSKLNNLVIIPNISNDTLDEIALAMYDKKFPDLDDNIQIDVISNHDEWYNAHVLNKSDKKKKKTSEAQPSATITTSIPPAHPVIEPPSGWGQTQPDVDFYVDADEATIQESREWAPNRLDRVLRSR